MSFTNYKMDLANFETIVFGYKCGSCVYKMLYPLDLSQN